MAGNILLYVYTTFCLSIHQLMTNFLQLFPLFGINNAAVSTGVQVFVGKYVVLSIVCVFLDFFCFTYLICSHTVVYSIPLHSPFSLLILVVFFFHGQSVQVCQFCCLLNRQIFILLIFLHCFLVLYFIYFDPNIYYILSSTWFGSSLLIFFSFLMIECQVI